MLKIREVHLGFARKARRVSYGVLDQAVLSLGSLSLSVASAHSGSVEDFSAFAVLFLVYTLSLSVARAFISMTLLTMESTDPRDASDARRAGAIGCAAAFGVCAAIAWYCLAQFLTQSGAAFQAVGAVALLLALIQDALRFVQLVRVGEAGPLVLDALGLAAQAVVLGSGVAVDLLSIELVALSWAAGNLVSIVLGITQTRSVPTWSLTRLQFRRSTKLGIPLTVEAMAAQGGQSLAAMLMVIVAGTNYAAGLRGAQTLFGPVSVITAGVLMIATPMALNRRADRAALRNLASAYGMGAALLPLAVVFVAVAIPEAWGQLLLGSSWSTATLAVIPLGISAALTGVTIGALLGFRGLGIARPTAVARMFLIPAPSLACLIGWKFGGIQGAYYGMTFESLCAAITMWVLFSHQLQKGSER